MALPAFELSNQLPWYNGSKHEDKGCLLPSSDHISSIGIHHLSSHHMYMYQHHFIVTKYMTIYIYINIKRERERGLRTIGASERARTETLALRHASSDD